MKRFFALDDYYDHDRKAYYAALQTVDPDTQDLTAWLEYFTEGVAVSTKAVRDRVIGLSKDIKVLKERGQIALTDRQMSIVEMMVQKGRVGVGEVARAFQISRQSALKEMDKLVDLAVVLPRGRGRTAHYVLS
jgi:Fic family protein